MSMKKRKAAAIMSRHEGMHFLYVDDHQAGGMVKRMMKSRRRRRKRRSMREFWRDGVPALTVEQRHLEVFTSAVTQRADRPNSYNTHSATQSSALTTHPHTEKG